MPVEHVELAVELAKVAMNLQSPNYRLMEKCLRSFVHAEVFLISSHLSLDSPCCREGRL